VKVYQVDDYHKVVANDIEEAKKYWLENLCEDEEYFDGKEVDITKTMIWYFIDKLPKELYHPPFEDWGYGPCCKIPLKLAIEMNKKHGVEVPYCIAVSSDLL